MFDCFCLHAWRKWVSLHVSLLMAHASRSIYSTAGMWYWNGRRKVGFLGLAMQIYDLYGLCPWTLGRPGGALQVFAAGVSECPHP